MLQRQRHWEAFDYVVGYTIVNDVSARDWVPGVFAAKGNMPSILAWEYKRSRKAISDFLPNGSDAGDSR